MAMFDVKDKPEMVERAFLVGAYFERRNAETAANLLAELGELVDTLNIKAVGKLCIFVRNGNARFLTGKGKCAEVAKLAREAGADVIVFDNELSPMQQRAWEDESGITVIDREEVILDIFKMRAQTREAYLQVELARMQYALPRLARMWSHLDRQGGGGGGGGKGAARGEGEQQIEVDRRLARNRIDRLRTDLEEVRKNRDTQRKQRIVEGMAQAAIVGYTNAGKSSLLNKLAGSSVLVEDQLFATLDPTTRAITLPDGQTLLLTDTVGFIRNLPHRLVEAFKATLEESIYADFLIHVLDASAPEIFAFYETTVQVLASLGAVDKPTLIVLNKFDLIEDDSARIQELTNFFEKRAIFISATREHNLEQLKQRFCEMLRDRVSRLELRIPQSRHELVALLHREANILKQEYEGNDVLITAVVPHLIKHRFEGFVVQMRT